MRIAFKAFTKDLKASLGRGFSFETGVWHEEEEAGCIRCGFHAAENPLDCFSYYPNWDRNVYWIVLLDGDMDEDGTDTKVAATRIKLVRQLTKEEFVICAMNYMAEHPFLPVNTCVKREVAQSDADAKNGILIVRGSDPIASGKDGDVVGIAPEDPDGTITDLNVFTIDGKEYLPDVFYDVHGKRRREYEI